MKALTLRSPWAWCVCYLGKPVENRGWAPSRSDLASGEQFAIHASKLSPLREIQTAFDWMLDEELIHVAQMPTMDDLRRQSSSIVAVATYAGAKTSHESGWFVGHFGWTWSELQVLDTPVPCRGFQKLWTMPAEVEALVREQLAHAHTGSSRAMRGTTAEAANTTEERVIRKPQRGVCGVCGCAVVSPSLPELRAVRDERLPVWVQGHLCFAGRLVKVRCERHGAGGLVSGNPWDNVVTS